MTVIHWFRRDLRLEDNRTLIAALNSGEQIVPVFIFDPAILISPRTGAPRVQFLLRALRSLDHALRAYGGGLLVRHGDPATVLSALAHNFGATAVYAHQDYSPFARRRDAGVAHALDIPLRLVDDVMSKPPGSIVSNSGEPYRIYTPFMKKWRIMPPPSHPENRQLAVGIFHSLAKVDNPGVPELADLGFAATIAVPDASPAVAQRRLTAFVSESIYGYEHKRNALISDPFDDNLPVGTSQLSPYLRLGLLSPRAAYWSAQDALASAPDDDARKSVNTWINELIWREFYTHILCHFPHVDRGNFRREYDKLTWRDAPQEFEAWQRGETGYPLVDAAMRQLRQIGWVPNRARMIVASFLTKDLLIHWRAGERHFMKWLIDGDPAANNGGWQWAAGTGTDAPPFFRIFNPVLQSKKYDPDGSYIRRWVPELEKVSSRYIHAPWELVSPPSDYPSPIVDHGFARERALAASHAVR
jgi:deoxyribodipyrimidine photo-lyase